MEFMQYCKLQIGCLMILLYIASIYFLECKRYNQRDKRGLFSKLLILAIISVLLDGITAYTVNHLDTISITVNMVLHALFLLSIDTVIFVLYLYILDSTVAYPENKIGKIITFVPFNINVIVALWNISSLEYRKGDITNYSMGIPAYTCFIMAGVYIILTIATFFRRRHYIKSQKRASIFTYLLVLSVITGIQMMFPETLITSIGVTFLVLGVYMNLEAPALKELSRYHSEVVMGFANLIENRDDNTGGHIKRTSKYVELIAEELRNQGQYTEVLTNDYVDNLVKAAPMHDIGKISVPDSILQKPGKLTNEEFNLMKLHAENGGKIIQKSFQHLGNEEFLEMAYQVARFHHEKWNGKGYPEGLKRKEIPLCARIMAVADVFDAVSEKRCYREAMPLEKCFEIIENGSGQDFDPIIVEVFLEIKSKVEEIHTAFEELKNNQ